MQENDVLSEKLFLTAYVLWMLSSAIGLTTLSTTFSVAPALRRVTQNLSIGIILIKCLRGRYSSKAILAILFITPIVTYGAYKSGNVRYLTLWFFAVGMQDVDVDTVIRVTYRFLVVLIPSIMLLRVIGVIPDHLDIFGTFSSRYGIQRQALGFSHPNGLGMKFFELAACYCYLHRDFISLKTIASVGFLALLTFLIPNSLGSFVAIIMLLGVSVYFALHKQENDSELRRFAWISTVLSLAFNIYSIFVGKNGVDIHPLVAKVDSFASDRLLYSHIVFDYYGFGLFGQTINVGRGEYADFSFLDNSYIDLLLRQGLLVYLIITVVILLTIFKQSKADMFYGSILFIYALLGITTNGAFNIASNPFILSACYLLYNNKRLQLGEELLNSETSHYSAES